MSELMEKAINAIAKLPEAEQDAMGAWILEEIDSERRWSRAFEESQDILAELADEALEELRTGKTFPLDPDEL